MNVLVQYLKEMSARGIELRPCLCSCPDNQRDCDWCKTNLKENEDAEI